MEASKTSIKQDFMSFKKVELEKAWVEQVDEKIIRLNFKDGVEIELKDAIEINKTFYTICKGKPFLSLIDARVYGSITADARDFFAKDVLVKDIRIAEAFVLNNLAIRLFARFYIKFSRPSNPIKIFSELDQAKAWLYSQYDQNIGENNA